MNTKFLESYKKLTEERLKNKENNMNPDLKDLFYTFGKPEKLNRISVPDNPRNDGMFEKRIYCYNCNQHSTVLLPVGARVHTGNPTPSYTLPNGDVGTIICGNCGAR